MKKSTRILLAAAAAAASLLVLLSIYFYLFRHIHRDINPHFGNITYDFEWGKVRRVRVDFNRDGVDDFIGEYDPPIRDPSDHDPFKRRWESSKCDGMFDLYIGYSPEGDIVLVRFDSDEDGQFDIEKSGKSGEALLHEAVRESCATWYPSQDGE